MKLKNKLKSFKLKKIHKNFLTDEDLNKDDSLGEYYLRDEYGAVLYSKWWRECRDSGEPYIYDEFSIPIVNKLGLVKIEKYEDDSFSIFKKYLKPSFII